jgi:hypothetical protein
MNREYFLNLSSLSHRLYNEKQSTSQFIMAGKNNLTRQNQLLTFMIDIVIRWYYGWLVAVAAGSACGEGVL